MGEYDAYVFLEEAGPQAISRFREHGLPSGIRYAASVSGPWDLFAIATFDALTSLPSIVASLSLDASTALAVGPTYTKTSDYHEVSAFVRIHIGKGQPHGILEEVREAINSHEANLVLGDFDILAYVGADTEDELVRTILHRVRKVQGIRKTISLHVIDYVTLNAKAGRDHHVRTKESEEGKAQS